jgi:hypothetical protein
LRTSRTKGGSYNRLGDEESGPYTERLYGVEEEDLSGFHGASVPMKHFTHPKKMASAADALAAERHLNEAGYAA